MHYIKIEFDDATYQYIKSKFNNDKKAMSAYVTKLLTEKVKTNSLNNEKVNIDNRTNDLKDYLESGESGSRSYGIKGQGW
jgi:hypothetical protein